MKRFFQLALCALAVAAIVFGSSVSAFAKPAAKAKTKAKPCVTEIHVIQGCSACEAMQAWLRSGGVKLDVTHVQQGKFKLYPTVIYSDKTADHGERMYKQQVTIPEKLCVTSCSIGTE